jgi:putative serine protease PepD
MEQRRMLGLCRCSSAAQQGTGSGVVLRSDGYILTNAHVVEGTTRITVTLQSGKPVDAELVGSDATDDLAQVTVGSRPVDSR